MTNTEKGNVVDTFLKFAYCFPPDIDDRFKETFGESLGNHFYAKFRGHCDKRENTFVAMIYTVGDMTDDNKALFMELIEDYYGNKIEQ